MTLTLSSFQVITIMKTNILFVLYQDQILLHIWKNVLLFEDFDQIQYENPLIRGRTLLLYALIMLISEYNPDLMQNRTESTQATFFFICPKFHLHHYGICRSPVFYFFASSYVILPLLALRKGSQQHSNVEDFNKKFFFFIQMHLIHNAQHGNRNSIYYAFITVGLFEHHKLWGALQSYYCILLKTNSSISPNCDSQHVLYIPTGNRLKELLKRH